MKGSDLYKVYIKICMGTSVSHVSQIIRKINNSRMSGAKTDLQNSAIASHQHFFFHLASSSIISLYKTGSCYSSSFIVRVLQNRKYFNRISRPKIRSCFCVVYYTTPHFCSNFPPLPSCFFLMTNFWKFCEGGAHCLQQNLAYILMLLAVHLPTYFRVGKGGT